MTQSPLISNPRSLSDLGIVDCKLAPAVHFSPSFCPMAMLWGCKFGKKCSRWGRFSRSTLQARQAPGASSNCKVWQAGNGSNHTPVSQSVKLHHRVRLLPTRQRADSLEPCHARRVLNSFPILETSPCPNAPRSHKRSALLAGWWRFSSPPPLARRHRWMPALSTRSLCNRAGRHQQVRLGRCGRYFLC